MILSGNRIFCVFMVVVSMVLNAEIVSTPLKSVSGMTRRCVLRRPRGWSRLGSMGNGEFCGYSFGRTIYRSTNEVSRVHGSRGFLVSEQQLTDSVRNNLAEWSWITSVRLWNTKDAHRLARVEVSCESVTSENLHEYVRRVRSRIEMEFSLVLERINEVPCLSGRDVAKKYYQWHAEDAKFKITLSSYLESDDRYRVSVAVESKYVLEEQKNKRCSTCALPPNLRHESPFIRGVEYTESGAVLSRMRGVFGVMGYSNSRANFSNPLSFLRVSN